MSETAVVLSLKRGRAVAKVEGTRVAFGPGQALTFDGGSEDIQLLKALGAHLSTLPGTALVGPQHVVDYLFRHVPQLRPHLVGVVITPDMRDRPMGNPVQGLLPLPPTATTAFICEPAAFPRMELRRAIPAQIAVHDLAILAEVAPQAIPLRAWLPLAKNIYPIDVPRIQLQQGLDLVMVDCPSRNLALMPNGLAYVNNALKKTRVSHQILDLDIIAYHRFHIHRLYDRAGNITLPSGRTLPEDP